MACEAFLGFYRLSGKVSSPGSFKPEKGALNIPED